MTLPSDRAQNARTEALTSPRLGGTQHCTEARYDPSQPAPEQARPTLPKGYSRYRPTARYVHRAG